MLFRQSSGKFKKLDFDCNYFFEYHLLDIQKVTTGMDGRDSTHDF